MRCLDNLKISIKIFLIIGLMSGATIFVTLMLSQKLIQADNLYNEMISRDVPNRVDALSMRVMINQMLYMSYKVLTYDGASEEAKASAQFYNSVKKHAQDTLEQLLSADPKHADFYRKKIPIFGELAALTDQAVAAGLENNDKLAKNLLGKADLIADTFRTEIGDFIKLQSQEMDQKASDLTSGMVWSVRIGYLAAFFSLAIAAALGLWISARKISAPITKLSETMGRLSNGDLEVAIEGQERKDEIGTMSQAVISFKSAAIERVRLEADAAQARQQAEQERTKREAEKLEESRQDQIMIETLAGSLARMADGDLSFQIEQVFAPKVERIRLDFNDAIKKLREVLQKINVNADTLHSSASEIASASDDLAKRTEQQAASLEETTAALNEITQTVKKTAEGANHASKVVVSAKAEADASSKIVAEAIVSMGEIEKSSHQITQIIGVIDEIAFQTNLLALNAGVEAARAGEAGRGFAVVASEVRALAQRSAEAAKEIKALISTSSNQVAQGVEHVTETGQALNKIVEQVMGISQIVSEIASSSQSQSAALQEVNVAVNQMDQMTQQNAAMVEETTAAARSLDHQCNDLKNLVGQFQTAAAGSTKRKSSALRAAA